MTHVLAQITEGPSSMSNMLMAAGMALAVFVVMSSLRKRTRRSANAPTPSQRLEQTKQAHGMTGDMRQMMVELEELTRRFSAQLDAKAHRLERLLEQADERIATLQAVSTGKQPAPAAAEIEPAPEPIDPLSQAVYRLADGGKTPIDIARELDEHVGKVELILALRQ